jgi:hypothetical protein
MTFGALTAKDVDVLLCVLAEYRNRPMRFLEIGVFTGQTARGIRDFCAQNNVALEYWGIDSGVQNDGKPPFEGANMIVGDSAESAHLVPDILEVVLSDSCHCFNHVILETVLYGQKVSEGGFFLHHDTAPHCQKTMRDPHGPDHHRFYNSVNEALRSIRWPWPEWEPWEASYDPSTPWGGMTAHRKRIGAHELA